VSRTLDARLAACASFVRQGRVFCDVGTDHAYLPLYLLEEGRISRAVATDIGEGPLASARAHLAEAGMLDRVKLVLTDGLAGLENEGVEDIAVCGMGGELICHILQNAPFTKNPDLRLILQPMTHIADLRRFLAENGYAVTGERLSLAAGRVYSCLCATYDGNIRSLSPAEALFGLAPQEQEQKALYAKLLSRIRAALEKQVQGREAGSRSGAPISTRTEETLPYWV
jgi:tRNA (adenine22-N1)-methyltransferase